MSAAISQIQSARATAPAQPRPALPVVAIEAKSNWLPIDWRECLEYRDLLYYLVLRDVTVLYKQTVLGVAWAVLNPLFSMIVFTVIFGRMLHVSSDGKPYAVFSYVALLPWTYFSQALAGATGSLIQGASLFTKVYFPRAFLPLVPVLSKLVDFAIAFGVLLGLMVWFRLVPSWRVVFLPLLMALMVLTASGVGMFLAALAIQYRDVRHAMAFVIQALMYAAPVVWPTSKLPPEFRLWYGLYPMVGVIEGFRVALLNTGPMPWDLIGLGAITAVLSGLLGAVFFRRTERRFADLA